MAETMTQRQESLFTIAQAILVEQLGMREEKVKMDSKFIEDLGCDSLDTIELVMEMEDRFGLSIPDEEAQKLLVVRELVTWLDENGAEL